MECTNNVARCSRGSIIEKNKAKLRNRLPQLGSRVASEKMRKRRSALGRHQDRRNRAREIKSDQILDILSKLPLFTVSTQQKKSQKNE